MNVHCRHCEYNVAGNSYPLPWQQKRPVTMCVDVDYEQCWWNVVVTCDGDKCLTDCGLYIYVGPICACIHLLVYISWKQDHTIIITEIPLCIWIRLNTINYGETNLFFNTSMQQFYNISPFLYLVVKEFWALLPLRQAFQYVMSEFHQGLRHDCVYWPVAHAKKNERKAALNYNVFTKICFNLLDNFSLISIQGKVTKHFSTYDACLRQ